MEISYFGSPPGYLKVAAMCASAAGLFSFLFLLYGWAFMVFGTLMMGLCNSTLLIIYHATGKLTPMDGFYESAFSMLMAILLFASAILIGSVFNATSAGVATTIFCGFGSLFYLLETGFDYKNAVAVQIAQSQRNLQNSNVYLATNVAVPGIVTSPVVVAPQPTAVTQVSAYSY